MAPDKRRGRTRHPKDKLIIRFLKTLAEVTNDVFFTFLNVCPLLKYNATIWKKRKETSVRTINTWCPRHSRQTTMSRDTRRFSLPITEKTTQKRRPRMKKRENMKKIRVFD
jgi:hypothetical protein